MDCVYDDLTGEKYFDLFEIIVLLNDLDKYRNVNAEKYWDLKMEYDKLKKLYDELLEFYDIHQDIVHPILQVLRKYDIDSASKLDRILFNRKFY